MNKNITHMKRLFKLFGSNEENLNNVITNNTEPSISKIALVRINISSHTQTHEIMETVITSITSASYDIESILSNLLVVPVHNEFEDFNNNLKELLSEKSISIVTSNLKGYIGTYGGNNRQHYGRLSKDMDNLVNNILNIEFGEIKHIA